MVPSQSTRYWSPHVLQWTTMGEQWIPHLHLGEQLRRGQRAVMWGLSKETWKAGCTHYRDNDKVWQSASVVGGLRWESVAVVQVWVRRSATRISRLGRVRGLEGERCTWTNAWTEDEIQKSNIWLASHASRNRWLTVGRKKTAGRGRVPKWSHQCNHWAWRIQLPQTGVFCQQDLLEGRGCKDKDGASPEWSLKRSKKKNFIFQVR